MTLAKELTIHSLPEIGSNVGCLEGALDTKWLYDFKRLYRKTCATTSRGQRYSIRSRTCRRLQDRAGRTAMDHAGQEGPRHAYQTMGRPIPWPSITRSTYWRGLAAPLAWALADAYGPMGRPQVWWSHCSG